MASYLTYPSHKISYNPDKSDIEQSYDYQLASITFVYWGQYTRNCYQILFDIH